MYITVVSAILARSHCVFGYPKQNATVSLSEGSLLTLRASVNSAENVVYEQPNNVEENMLYAPTAVVVVIMKQHNVLLSEMEENCIKIVSFVRHTEAKTVGILFLVHSNLWKGIMCSRNNVSSLLDKVPI
jgi:hypothetical protein